MKIMTITFELEGDTQETLAVQASVLSAMLHFSGLVPGLAINVHHICACGQCRIEEHIHQFKAGKQTIIQ